MPSHKIGRVLETLPRFLGCGQMDANSSTFRPVQMAMVLIAGQRYLQAIVAVGCARDNRQVAERRKSVTEMNSISDHKCRTTRVKKALWTVGFSSPQPLRHRAVTGSAQPSAIRSDPPQEGAIRRFAGSSRGYSTHYPVKQSNSHGFSLPELLITLLVAMILTGIAIPAVNGAMTSMRLNSTVSTITAAVSRTRYRAIMDSQPYTVVLTTPGNSYVVTNVTTNTADAAVPLPSQGVAVNGGTNATYTFTLCPNGTVYGAGGTCPGTTLPPALSATYQGRQTDINVSSVGNVTTTIVH